MPLYKIRDFIFALQSAEISGLDAALASKMDYAERSAPDGVCELIAGKVPQSRIEIPAIAITDTYPVASEGAMLSLTAQRGDVAIRTDLSNQSYILTTDDPTTLANWVALSDRIIDWIEITNKPATYPPGAHNHDYFSDIVGRPNLVTRDFGGEIYLKKYIFDNTNTILIGDLDAFVAIAGWGITNSTTDVSLFMTDVAILIKNLSGAQVASGVLYYYSNQPSY